MGVRVACNCVGIYQGYAHSSAAAARRGFTGFVLLPSGIAGTRHHIRGWIRKPRKLEGSEAMERIKGMQEQRDEKSISVASITYVCASIF